MKMIRLLLSSALLATVLVQGCAVASELERNRELWDSQNIADSEYRLQLACFCPPDVTSEVMVTVSSGETMKVTYTDGVPVTSPTFEKFNTVDKLFDYIDNAYEEGAFEVRVTYDEDLGIPMDVHVDFIENAVDEELGFTVSGFRPGE